MPLSINLQNDNVLSLMASKLACFAILTVIQLIVGVAITWVGVAF